MDEDAIMRLLREHLAQPEVKALLDTTAREILVELRDASVGTKSTFRAIPLEVYGGDLPPDIRSAWLFALRKAFAHPPERHPNSIQRMFAWGTPGQFEVWDGEWLRHELDPGGAGLSIAADRWHRAPALDQDWVVASFHTAEADALVEIVGDPASGEVDSKRVYLAER